MNVVLVVLLGVALSLATYFRLERAGRRAWPAMVSRAIAWSALGILVLNLSCPTRSVVQRPLVLLDASLSLGAAGGRWTEARDSAFRWGEVQLFGDERLRADTLPSRGRSLLEPALLAASASERQVVVVTDGEIEDLSALPPDLRDRMGIRLFPRLAVSDRALTRVSGPARVTAKDSIPFDIEIRAFGKPGKDSITVEIQSGRTIVLRRRVRLSGEGITTFSLKAPSGGLAAGQHLLRVALSDAADEEPRDDARLHLVTVAPTPGVVLLASPADWDARFLYRALKDVAQLPVRGFVQLEAGRWRTMTDLSVVSPDNVRRAARQADLLIIKGASEELARESKARGVLRWPSGETGETVMPGDWYLSVGGISPLSGVFVGAPIDSFPPAIRVTPMQAASGDWVALVAQEGRRGPERPVVLGRVVGRVREITVAADGLWRWAFRGGSSEQTYRAWVAAVTSWLLGGADPALGRARAVRAVVPNARPVTFEWIGAGAPEPLPLTWESATGTRRDTLRFDGSGRASAWLDVGEYRYRLEGGGSGALGVEQYSDEWLPRPAVLGPKAPRTVRAGTRTSAREQLWLFAVCVLALSAEWLVRRRLGLR